MPSREEKQQIVRWIRKWRRRYLLDSWKCAVEFAETPREDDHDCMADIHPRFRYDECSLTIYPLFWLQDAATREDVIAHELAHNITEHLDSLVRRRLKGRRVTPAEADDVVEKTTEWIKKCVSLAYHGR